ncbi:MAG TPA: GNAT family N-acetyltransferase [Ktedonobacterales bacterium]
MSDRMPERDPVALDDRHALATLDNHFALQLRCAPSDLRRPAWTITVTNADVDPTALLFGQRMLLTLIAPSPSDDAAIDGGVALVAPELRQLIGEVLRAWTPATIFTAEGRAALDDAMHAAAPRAQPSAAEAHTHLRYAIPGTFRPYLGQWLDWIEPLDESTEMEPAALSLLARYGGGIYVVREHGSIVAYAAMRTQSPAISELHVRTLPQALRGHGLGRAVASRATRSILTAGRVPLLTHQARDLASGHLATALGYRLYARAATYTAALH